MNISGRPVSVVEYTNEHDKDNVPEEIMNAIIDANMVIDLSKDVTPKSVSRMFHTDDARVVIRVNENNEVFYIRATETKPNQRRKSYVQ